MTSQAEQPKSNHRPLRVLVGCERSGVVRDAFRSLGHDAWSCDLVHDDTNSEFHLVEDLRSLFSEGWDLLIAHPPCTRLANSASRWVRERALWTEQEEAARLFLACLDAPIPRVAVENPVMSREALRLVGRGPDFCTQPYLFGDPVTKKTCFWLRGLRPLHPTRPVRATHSHVDAQTSGVSRGIARSVTFPGLAAAMAAQWGRLPPARR